MSDMNYIVHGYNLFADGVSKHLVIASAQLPTLEEATRDFTPGGGHMGYQVPLASINALELGFSLVNRDPQVLALMGLNSGQTRTYTLYENLVDEFTGDEQSRVITVIGRMGSAAPQENRNPELVGIDYRIRSIHTYTDVFAGRMVHGFYLKTNRRIVNGVEQNRIRNRNLGI